MLNPMSRHYQGYVQANQSPVVEEENENESAEERDIEAGHATRHSTNTAVKSHGKRKVSWEGDGDISEMNLLRPNIRREDKTYEHDTSDDEVPQSFMIEASRSSRNPASPTSGTSQKGKGRSQPLYSTSSRSLPRETNARVDMLPTVSIPPRPSELDVNQSPQVPSRQQTSPKPLRGLDAYERALWNWVNVYNLDAFLQEVYLYYEGKGIYSIALTRGLNLLSVALGIGVNVG
jgi:autophagy-related protein 9